MSHTPYEYAFILVYFVLALSLCGSPRLRAGDGQAGRRCAQMAFALASIFRNSLTVIFTSGLVIFAAGRRRSGVRVFRPFVWPLRSSSGPGFRGGDGGVREREGRPGGCELMIVSAQGQVESMCRTHRRAERTSRQAVGRIRSCIRLGPGARCRGVVHRCSAARRDLSGRAAELEDRAAPARAAAAADRPGLVAIGTVMLAVPVNGSVPKVSPMPRIAPPAGGRLISGAPNWGTGGAKPPPILTDEALVAPPVPASHTPSVGGWWPTYQSLSAP